MRESLRPRYWHIVLCAIVGTGIFILIDSLYWNKFGELPSLKVIWGVAVIVPLLMGIVATAGAGGAALWKRIAGAAICGAAVGIISAVISGWFGANDSLEISVIAINGLWRAFVFTTVSVIGVLLTEVNMPEPDKMTIEN
jgi:hypothetical protein